MNDEQESLPPRRLSRTVEFVHNGFRIQITIGYYSNGRIGEVSLVAPLNGTALSHIVFDACELITELLQRYVSPETLTELIRRTEDGGAESIIGEIILQLAQSP